MCKREREKGEGEEETPRRRRRTRLSEIYACPSSSILCSCTRKGYLGSYDIFLINFVCSPIVVDHS